MGVTPVDLRRRGRFADSPKVVADRREVRLHVSDPRGFDFLLAPPLRIREARSRRGRRRTITAFQRHDLLLKPLHQPRQGGVSLGAKRRPRMLRRSGTPHNTVTSHSSHRRCNSGSQGWSAAEPLERSVNVSQPRKGGGVCRPSGTQAIRNGCRGSARCACSPLANMCRTSDAKSYCR